MPFVAVNVIKVLVLVSIYAFLLFIARSMRGHLVGPPAASTTKRPADDTPPAAVSRPVLFVTAANGTERQHSLDTPVLIGRGASSDIVIDDEYASDRHARVGVTAGTAWVEDLGSTNGTTVGGTPIEGRIDVARGSEIVVGRTKMVVR